MRIHGVVAQWRAAFHQHRSKNISVLLLLKQLLHSLAIRIQGVVRRVPRTKSSFSRDASAVQLTMQKNPFTTLRQNEWRR